jgi:hypothetical protein
MTSGLSVTRQECLFIHTGHHRRRFMSPALISGEVSFGGHEFATEARMILSQLDAPTLVDHIRFEGRVI